MSLGDGAAPENGGAPLGLTKPAAPAGSSNETKAQVQEVLASEIGVATMLNKLKQSIASCKEFAQFLKKRSILEQEHANGLRKLCRISQDNMMQGEHRTGTFAKAYEEMMATHEKMAENGLQFATSLHQMHEDLVELAAVAEKSRKGWKQSGLVAEQKVADLDTAMRKSKAKYDSLAEEYDRARTGDTTGRQGGKMFGFKGPKSSAQHEEDLLRKTQAADSDYKGKVQVLQDERNELITRTRPDTIKALQDCIRETDAGTTLQLQKFASFNEKLLLSNGLSISPLKASHEQRSLREVVQAIDNDKDLDDYLRSQFSRLPPRAGDPKYERNPLLDQAQRQPTGFSSSLQGGGPTASGAVQQPLQQPQLFNSTNSRSSTFDSPVSPPGQGPMGHSYGQSTGSIQMIPPTQRPGSQPQHERSFSVSSALNQGSNPNGPYGGPRGPPAQQQPPQIPSSRFNTSVGSSTPQGPPQLGALPFQNPQPPQQPPPQQYQAYQPSQHQGGLNSNPLQQHPPGPAQRQSPPAAPQMAPTKPMFGVSLTRLYERDGHAVPMVVYQCIQAVNLFGLHVEGIYRLSGSLPHVNKLKAQFDTDPNSANLDFRNPENFFHDVNGVAGLLKTFFRDLPDPLLTNEHYMAFIEAAKQEDETVRRDSLHAIINSLPDPNYATLRTLTLHLHKVIENAATNRMSSQNLAIVFGPTLMGTGSNASIADSGWQIRVVETILNNTYQIFDDDD
ncbi:RHO GTPase-activating protein RGD1 [Naviculisporaceae sp. PSN 640]